MLRLLEPLRAPEEAAQNGADWCSKDSGAVDIEFRSVGATVSGHTILNELTFSIAAGQHVAIVGPSGAGKSSIASLLLGWLRASSGEIYVGGKPLDVDRLRRSTAWIAPAV